jgi:RES domain
MSETTNPPLGEMRFCFQRTLEPHLREAIQRDGSYTTYSYCKEEGETFSINQIADSVSNILSTLYYAMMLPVEGEAAGMSITETIRELLEPAGVDVAEDVQRVLAEQWANDNKTAPPEDNLYHLLRPYVRSNSVQDIEFDLGWHFFEINLKTKARYFNSEAEQFLKSIFLGIEERKAINGSPIVVEAGPGTLFEKLYRARVFQHEKDFREALKQPDVELGPLRKSPAFPGRMNAAGISVFYGATNAAVALAEVRPPTGCKVLVGCFEVIRALKLLDLVALVKLADKKGSVFDPAHLNELKRSEFLRGLTLRLSKPVMPNDEPTEYLPTQAIADFLAQEGWPDLDGIIYPSVQAGGHYRLENSRYGILGRPSRYSCNVILFHTASRVRALGEGAELSVSDYLFLEPEEQQSGPDLEYTVWLPPTDVAAEVPEDDASLRFESLEAHFVTGVRIDTQPMKTFRFSKEIREKHFLL